MCGICGFFSPSKPVPDADLKLEGMVRRLHHRGPDEDGFWRGEGVAFGHSRLRVIDLEGGRQPMTSSDGRFTLVFNGEIYNFLDLRRSLEAKGRRFVTRSDTESLLQLFEEEGPAAFAKLEGMFALAVYDHHAQTVYLAVDAFGKKPLYYSQDGGIMWFASELKGLVEGAKLARRLDETALARYLAFEYVPAPATIFKGIFKLEAGSYLEVTPSGFTAKAYRWVDRMPEPVSSGEWEERFFDRFRSAVQGRLVSDVPLGIFASGGLDSSSVLAMAKSLDPKRRFKTFTIGFDDPSFDESAYARQVSRFFDTEHIEETCSLEQMLREHGPILETLDEPYADASYIPTFLLCRLARKHVTVALSGDGGDELLAGYPTFQAEKMARFLRHLPLGFLKWIEKGVRRLPTSLDNLSLDFRLKQFFKGLTAEPSTCGQVWLGAFSEAEIRQTLDPSLKFEAQTLYRDVVETVRPSDGRDWLQRLQAFYFKFYLQGDILVKVDRASMANSLEVRSPLLDDALVQTALTMPSKMKLKGFTGKALLKKFMRGRLPETIVNRPKKGFGIPIAKWIRQDLRRDFEIYLDPPRIRREGLFNPHEVERLLKEHLAGRRDNRKPLWTLYVFQRWKERWF